jgi:4-amino-4-deoxy-L-arabinose transferase-like glycosyltransferase
MATPASMGAIDEVQPATTNTDERGGSGARWFVPVLVAIALVGVAIRLLDVSLALWRAHDILDDPAYYYLSAGHIAHGRWFIDPFYFAFGYGAIRPSAAHPPFFPLLLSVPPVLHLSTFVAARVFCCMIGGVGVFVVGMLGYQIGGRRVAVLAAAIAAIYPVWWLTDGLVVAEVLYAPLVAGLLILAYRQWHRPRASTAAAMGAVGGLAALTRGEGVLLLLVVTAWVLFGNRSLSNRRRARLLGVTVAVAAVLLAPWIGFNLSRFRDPVYLSTNGGITIADSNCPATYSGKNIGGDVFACHTPQVKESRDESVTSRRLTDVGVRYARNHAGRLPLVVTARVALTWGSFHPIQTLKSPFASFGHLSTFDAGLMLLSYWVVALTAIPGFVVLRRRGETVIPFVAALVTVTITVALFYGLVRFRVPGDVSLIVLAAVAIDAMLSRARLARESPPPSRAVPAGA